MKSFAWQRLTSFPLLLSALTWVSVTSDDEEGGRRIREANMFIQTIEPSNAEGEIASIYGNERASMGRVMEATRCWTARPDILAPVEHLLHQIRDGFSLGLVNFRLITLVAAKHVPSSFCSHVYFKALCGMIGREQTLAVHRDYRNAGLTEQQVAMLAYAEQITIDASRIDQGSIDTLRAVGLTDRNIADVALVASFRNFLSRYFDAVGARAEPEFLDDDPHVRKELAVGN
jgi:alkylhydroperoxidase family enzyme